MAQKLSIWRKIKAVLIILYAILLLVLIPMFFFNYGGEWLKKLAETLPVKEMNYQQHEKQN